MKKAYLTSLIAFGISINLASCLSYSFTGGSVPVNVGTFSVQAIENRAPLVEPNLAFSLTEQLKNLILSNTNLKMVDGTADAVFSGYISRYEIKPISVVSSSAGGSGGAQQNRLTVVVNIEYSDTKNPKNSFKQPFSAYQDFIATASFVSIKASLLENIIQQLTQNIYNRAFANW